MWNGCYQSSPAAMTKRHRRDILNNRHLFTRTPGGSKPKTEVLQGWFLPRPFSLACRWPLLAVSSHGLSTVHMPLTSLCPNLLCLEEQGSDRVKTHQNGLILMKSPL